MLLPPALGFSPHPPVSVFGTGAYGAIAAFLGGWNHTLRYFSFAPRHAFGSPGGFSCPTPHSLAPALSSPGRVIHPRPHISGHTRYRNLHLLSIGYASRPRLRPRLTQGRSALPWNPWIFGLEDSHLHLATHSGILSSRLSTAPLRYGFFLSAMLPYHDAYTSSRASVVCFSPGHFRRGASRLVSCYALFQCMAASEPTS